MNDFCRLNPITEDYLDEFCRILKRMKSGMLTANLTDSISYNFIVQMIPHHEGAIEMSRNLLPYGPDIALQNIAENIIREQTQSIEDMQRILCSCAQITNSRRSQCLYQQKMDQIMNTMFCRMNHACTDNNISADFMREMIPHHEGAIHMARTTLQYNICPGLVPILNAIISSQEKGVEEMRNLLRCQKC